MRAAVLVGALLVAGCGSNGDDTVEPVPQASPERAGALMTEAEHAAGNAEDRMSADAPSNNSVEARQ